MLDGQIAPSDEQRTATDQQSRDLTVKLVDFLKDYDAQKNPPVTDISSYGLFASSSEDLPDVPAIEFTGGADAWLTARFVELPFLPVVPEELRDYLPRQGGMSATQRPVPRMPFDDLPSITPEGDGPRPNEEAEQRLLDAEGWVEDEWTPWAEAWRQAQLGKEYYRRLFEQQQLIDNDRESYELVWGFGRLRWSYDGINVNHPLFTVTVEVEQGDGHALVVRPSGPLELETLPFANLPIRDRAALGRARQAVAAEPFDPWSTDVLASEARSAIRALHHHAVIAGEGARRPDAPVTDTGWVLFTRRRRPDRQGFLDAMRELYAGGAIPPDALSSIVVDAPSAYAAPEALPESTTTEGESSTPAEAEPLLLPLPSNEEQQRILLLAQQQSGVIVQGPPGTGKSHTIANLVSHYVAYGHRVLVVAEKEQALSVLAEKIPQEIRELAVSVLGSDQTSRKALETAITSIQARVSTMDKGAQDRRIASLTGDLRSMDAEIALTTDRLLAARRSETVTLSGTWAVGENPSPGRAAAWVAEHESALGFIPDRINPTVAPPISPDELSELKRLLRSIGLDSARQSAYVLPDLEKLPTVGDLAELFARRDQLRMTLEGAAPEITDWSPIDGAGAERLAEMWTLLSHELRCVELAEQPWLKLLAGQLQDPLLRTLWHQFDQATRSDREQIIALRPQLAAHHVEVPEAADPTFAGLLEQARQRLLERGKLGMFAGDLKRTLEQCRVDGTTPRSAEAIGLCLQQLHLAYLRRTMCVRWASQVSAIGGPELDTTRPEDMVGQHLERIAEVMRAPERWAYLLQALKQLGIAVHGGHAPATVRRTLTVLDIAASRPLERNVSQNLEELALYLSEGAQQVDASSLWPLLTDCLRTEMPVQWAEHRQSVVDLVDIAADARRLTQLASRLSAVAPAWADAIFTSPDAAGDPVLLQSAWQWRQLETWVRDVMGGDSPARLQEHLEHLGVARRRLVTELVGVRAWRRLADNLGDRQRQALNSYLAATKRYGKTGGKFAARWLAAIRDALNDSKDAVPVWIMTTSRALASFRPDARVPFDVVIVDEASQIGIDAVPLLALARRAIVVGDDKQTSPSAVGMDQQKVFHLIDSHLSEVRNHRVLFNPTNSLYDLAFQKFPRSVMLREHFRCLPEIISFSNQEFYGDKIEPLRENRPSPGWAALGAVKVTDGYRNGDTNEAEAHVVADLVEKMVDDPAYDGMDFGVVCLLSGAQSELIRTRLFNRLGPQVMTERRIRIGDAANFQGDERNVMLLSTVVATDPANPTGRIGAMSGTDAAQRINVAASRARDQMIVVYSVDPERLPAGDLRAGLIRHCRNPVTFDVDAQDQLARCDSEFERMVLRRILARGYARVRTQVHVGTTNQQFRIDLVVDGPESRLAVECDGERWHGEERWHADRSRQEVLERAGWTFCRIRGSSFFRDPDMALEPLWRRLDELGVPTGREWLDDAAQTATTVLEVRGLDTVPQDSDEPAEERHASDQPLALYSESVDDTPPVVSEDAHIPRPRQEDGGLVESGAEEIQPPLVHASVQFAAPDEGSAAQLSFIAPVPTELSTLA
jgi:very-short-patch-repair endonuclease